MPTLPDPGGGSPPHEQDDALLAIGPGDLDTEASGLSFRECDHEAGGLGMLANDLLESPAAVGEVLIWLHARTRTLDELVAKRADRLKRADENDAWVEQYACQSILFDLGRITHLVEWQHGRIALVKDCRDAVGVYAELARRVAVFADGLDRGPGHLGGAR